MSSAAEPARKHSQWSRIATDIRKRLGLGHSTEELDPYLATKELIFRGPPLTPELIATIKRISPQFKLRQDQESLSFWERNQNATCWGEYLALEPFLDRLPEKPAQVLDIGPGMGRSVVFFKKKRDWNDVPFHLYEGTGSSTKYTKAGPRFEDSFCGDLDVLAQMLSHNEIENTEIFDAGSLGFKLSGLPGPYDFIYSFFAVGFHWSIVHFLPELQGLMHERSIGAFTLHDRFTDYDALSDLPHRVVDFRRSWPKDRFSKMLVLGGSEEILEGL